MKALLAKFALTSMSVLFGGTTHATGMPLVPIQRELLHAPARMDLMATVHCVLILTSARKRPVTVTVMQNVRIYLADSNVHAKLVLPAMERHVTTLMSALHQTTVVRMLTVKTLSALTNANAKLAFLEREKNAQTLTSACKAILVPKTRRVPTQ